MSLPRSERGVRGGRSSAKAERRPPRSEWYVYLLRCGDGSLYAGATNDLARRLEAHGRGSGGRYTRSRLPVALVFSERARDHGAALRREAALKRLSRAEKLALVARRREASPARSGVRRRLARDQAVPADTPGSCGAASSGACAPGGASIGRSRSKT